MKKYIIVLFLVAFIVPSVALASWWNPFSWFNNWNFHKTETVSQTQIEKQKTSEEQIAELQKQLEDLKNSKDVSTTTSMPVTKKETVKNAPVVDNSEIIKKQVQAQLDAALKAKAEQDALIANQNSQKPEEQAVVESSSSDVTFKVAAIRQTIFENPNYGGFEISVDVTAGSDDVFVPKTTSDSTKSITGFSYSLFGDSFRGSQNSEVSCGTSTDINKVEYCKIKSGQTTTITTTVWLSAEQAGNYGVMFESINYLKGVNHESGSFDVNKGTQKIYIKY
jgi:hypothetical protein